MIKELAEPRRDEEKAAAATTALPQREREDKDARSGEVETASEPRGTGGRRGAAATDTWHALTLMDDPLFAF